MSAMAASKYLANQLKKMHTEPVEGIAVDLPDESNLYEWRIFIEGPKETLYEGGIFQMLMKFPTDFPMSPPELKFVSDFWHPNVYKETGLVCISILHSPEHDETSGERADERWRPTQTVITILLSVISLLNAPNFSSPANVDASVEWRKTPEQFGQKISRLVQKSLKEKPDDLIIPHPDSNPEEREKEIRKIKLENEKADLDEFMHDDNVYPDEEEDESEGESAEEVSDEKEEKRDETTDRAGLPTLDPKKKDKKSKKDEDSASPRKTRKKKKCLVM
eukprot:TRINITY_DN17187_c0_g1_i1.p1 TRINITY_DN17187_c0_g1~~TRINITY_DN17187_c0_g1_i1.p1  ORF type:complete len:277 (-),score=59.40 TRINITY_DN17187_c0_g1_i1:76-906(-)